MSQKDDFDLQEWRIRAEQDQAYQDSLKAEFAKVSCVRVYIGKEEEGGTWLLETLYSGW